MELVQPLRASDPLSFFVVLDGSVITFGLVQDIEWGKGF